MALALLVLELLLGLLVVVLLVVVVVLRFLLLAHELGLAARLLLGLGLLAGGLLLLAALLFHGLLLLLLASELFFALTSLLLGAALGLLGLLLAPLFFLLGGLLRSDLLLGGALVLLTLWLLVSLALLAAVDTEHLHDVGRCVNAGSGSPEHLLQEVIGVLWLLARYDLGWFTVDLISHNQLSQLEQLHEPINLGVLLSDGLAVELLALVETLAVASGLARSREDVVDVAEGGLA